MKASKLSVATRCSKWLLLLGIIEIIDCHSIVFYCHSFSYAVAPLGRRRPFFSRPKPVKSSGLMMAAGTGMGGASTRNRKSKKKGKKKKASASAPFDANASLLRLEKRYDELCLADAKDLQLDAQDDFQRQGIEPRVLSEYVIGVRAAPKSNADVRSVSDWIPVAQLCISQSMTHKETTDQKDGTTAGVSFYCRELSHAATLGVPVFKTLAREQIEYSAEPVNSFYKYVYDPIVGGTNDDDRNDQVMTKTEARSMLELEENVSDLSLVKQSYKKLSFELHPDRLLGQNLGDQELKDASKRYAQVKLAYETLISGGVRRNGDSSWYQSLGGRARTEFFGPIPLMTRELAQSWIKQNNVDFAVVGLDPEITTPFLLRNQASL